MRAPPRQAGQRQRVDHGAVATELVIATPLLMLLILLIVQFAIWAHAAHIASATAKEALAAARVSTAHPGDGQAQANALLHQLGRGVLTGPRVTVTRTAQMTRVQVSGHAESVIPWLHLPVSAVAQGPTEHFQPDTAKP